MADTAGTVYRLATDADDAIASVDESWLEFARENGAPELTREAVLGRSLWDFVAGDGTRALYRAIAERVRATDAAVLLPFRCDSPEFRREMRLEVSHHTGGTLHWTTVLVRIEPRLHLGVMEASQITPPKRLSLCSVCRRVRSDAGEWLDAEDAAARFGLFRHDDSLGLVYRVCPNCASRAGVESAQMNAS